MSIVGRLSKIVAPVFQFSKNRKANILQNGIPIIGSGLGALTCGAFLSKRGVPVIFFESKDQIGGLSKSFERNEGRFKFNVSSDWPLGMGTEIVEILQKIGIDQFSLQPSKYPDLLVNNKLIKVPSGNTDQLIKNIVEFYPDEENGLTNYFTEARKITKEGERLLKDGLQFSVMRIALFPYKYMTMFQYRERTLEKSLQTHIKSPEVRNILESFWLFYGTPASILPANYYHLYCTLGLEKGIQTLKESSYEIAQILRKEIMKHGGKFEMESNIEIINTQNRHIWRIIDQKGRTFSTRMTIYNGSLSKLFKDMLPDFKFSNMYQKRIDRIKPSLSAFILWLGLNSDITQTINSQNIIVRDSTSSDEEYNQMQQSPINNKTPFQISITKGTTPNTSIVKIYAPTSYSHWIPYEWNYFRGEKHKYLQEKNRIISVFIQRASRIIEDLPSLIETQDAATPLTFRRYGNSECGSIFGTEQRMENSFMTRLDNKTPVKGLYLTGAWANPGHGIFGTLAAGKLTYLQIAKDYKL